MSQPLTNKKTSRKNSRTPGIGRMLVLSFTLHVVVFVIFGGYVVPRIKEDNKPVYYVDLINSPVANPRAGRPDAAAVKKKIPAKKKKKAAIKKPPVKKTPVKKPPVKKTVPVKKVPPVIKKVVETVPIAQPIVTPPKKVEPTLTPIVPVTDSDPMDAIEQMRRKQRIAALKEKLSRLATESSTAPVGVVGGSGDQAGSDFDGWIKSFLSQAWALPAHYRQRGLVATMLLRFNSQGQMVYTEMLRSSGDNFFDASVKRAVQQLQRLPNEPKNQLEFTVTFDPREMLGQ